MGIKNITALCLVLCIFTAFTVPKTLKGTWEYAGGIYNGKPDSAPSAYKMQRVYTDKDFNAFLIQKGQSPQRYEAGNYQLKADTCFEKSTYSSQPSQLVGKTVAYFITLKNKELILSARLPSGMIIEEHWKKIK